MITDKEIQDLLNYNSLLIRVSCLEKLLISKGITTSEELKNEAFELSSSVIRLFLSKYKNHDEVEDIIRKFKNSDAEKQE